MFKCCMYAVSGNSRIEYYCHQKDGISKAGIRFPPVFSVTGVGIVLYFAIVRNTQRGEHRAAARVSQVFLR